MYTPGKLRHQRKSFSPPSEFRQDETEKSGMFVNLNGGKGRSMENAFSPFKRNINIDPVRPDKASTLAGGVKIDKILLVLNEFRYGVKGGRR